MILQRYFAWRYAKSFAGVLGVFFLILTLIDLVEQNRRFADDGLGTVLWLTLLNMPEGLYEILPLVVIIAAVALFLALSRSSELVATRAAGRSAIRSLVGPVLTAMVIGAGAVAAINPIVAATSVEYERLRDILGPGDASALSVEGDGLWLRQGAEDGQTLIRAARANLDGTELYGVTFMGFGEGGAPRYRIEAARARLENGAWRLTDAKEWRFDGNANPERTAFERERLSLASNLTPRQILDSFGTPAAVPIWDLPAFIARLEEAGFSARAHRVWFHQELAQPLFLAAMVLVGAGLNMRPARFGRQGTMVILALGLGFALYFARNFAAVLGENGQIPVLLAAYGPPVAALLLPLGILLHLEDG